MKTPQTIAELIDLWPSAEVFSDDLGLKYRSHGRVMRLRGRVAKEHWPKVVAAASRRSIQGISEDLLARLHEKARPEEGRAA